MTGASWLTARDHEVAAILAAFAARHGRLPTHKQAAALLDMCRGQFCRHVARLVDAGVLHPLPRGTMNYRLEEAIT